MIALTDQLPLRDTTAWGSFAGISSSNSTGATKLPHRYGACGGTLVQYDRQRTQFVWADHAVESIDQVLVDGVPATDWTWANVTDVSGHTVAMVTLQQKADLGANLIARGKGKLHPATGARMTDPAAVLWDVLANIAGRTLNESQLGAFSVACALRDLEVAGSIEASDQVQAFATAICASVGALFSAHAPGLALLWPGVAVGAALATVGTQPGLTVSASAARAALVNDLTIRYAFEAGSPRQSLRLQAPDSVRRYGLRAQTLDLAWVGSPRTAYDAGTRLLQQQARPQWVITANGMKRALRIGQPVAIAHPLLPVTGTYPVLGAETDFAHGLTNIDLTVPVGSAPAVVIVQQSEAFDPQAYANIAIQTQGGSRILTIVDTDGRTPLPNAAVTLDGTLTRYTDNAGRVSFPVASMPPGEHQLQITTTDGRTLTLEVLVQ